MIVVLLLCVSNFEWAEKLKVSYVFTTDVCIVTSCITRACISPSVVKSHRCLLKHSAFRVYIQK